MCYSGIVAHLHITIRILQTLGLHFNISVKLLSHRELLYKLRNEEIFVFWNVLVSRGRVVSLSGYVNTI